MRKRILIAEDNQDLSELFVMILDRDFDVSLAEDGEQALACIEAQMPDLLILDINMPKVTGLEVIKALQQRFEVRPMKIIVLTANAYATISSPEIEYADIALVKPVNVDDFERIVKRLLI